MSDPVPTQDFVAYDAQELFHELELCRGWLGVFFALLESPGRSASVRQIRQGMTHGEKSVDRALQTFLRLGIAECVSDGGSPASRVYRLTARGNKLAESSILDWPTIVVR